MTIGSEATHINAMTNYHELTQQLAGVLTGERYWLTNLSQFAALLNDHLADINWVGFYLVTAPELLKLGPFQGRVACINIPFGKGVCGTAAASGETQLVMDVHAFPGHIACDARSQSEIVIPLFSAGRLLGVLDIDSPSLNRFSPEDQQGLEQMAQLLIKGTDWPDTFA